MSSPTGPAAVRRPVRIRRRPSTAVRRRATLSPMGQPGALAPTSSAARSELDQLATSFASAVGGRSAAVLVERRGRRRQVAAGRRVLSPGHGTRARSSPPAAASRSRAAASPTARSSGSSAMSSARSGRAEAAEVLGPLASGLGAAMPAADAASDGQRRCGASPEADERQDHGFSSRSWPASVNLAERSPVVLVFEDLQWADSATGRAAQLPHPQPGRRPRAAHRHLPQRRPRGRRPPARPWLTEIGRHARRHADHASHGFDRDETDPARSPGSSATCRTGPWSTRSGPGPGQPVLRRGARRRPPHARCCRRAAGRHPGPGRRALRRRPAGPAGGRRSPARRSTTDAGRGRRPRTSDALERALDETVDRQMLVVDTGPDRLPLPPRPAARGGRGRPAAGRAGPAAPPGRRRARPPTRHSARPSPAIGPPSWPSTGGRPGEWADALRASLAAADAAAAVLGLPGGATPHLERALAALDRAARGGSASRPIGSTCLLERTADARLPGRRRRNARSI